MQNFSLFYRRKVLFFDAFWSEKEGHSRFWPFFSVLGVFSKSFIDSLILTFYNILFRNYGKFYEKCKKMSKIENRLKNGQKWPKI